MWKIIGFILAVGFVCHSEAVKCMKCPNAAATDQQDCKEGKVDSFCEGTVCYKATVRVPSELKIFCLLHSSILKIS